MLVKRLVMGKAARKVILMDSSKYGKILPYTFGDVGDADFIVSDNELPEEFVRKAQEADVTVL